jgi:DNA-binding response OmpR family regulator
MGQNHSSEEVMNSHSDKQMTIFLIEEDDETRPLLRHNLISYGYRVIMALDEEDAMERASGGKIHADLVLVNLVGKTTEDTLSVGRRIREYGEFDGQTPLVVMAEKYSEDVEGTDVNVSGNDWITYLEESGQLRNLLNRLLPATAAPDA